VFGLRSAFNLFELFGLVRAAVVNVQDAVTVKESGRTTRTGPIVHFVASTLV
jgi:hypothetical protein